MSVLVRVPTLGVNDDSALLVSWSAAAGARLA